MTTTSRSTPSPRTRSVSRNRAGYVVGLVLLCMGLLWPQLWLWLDPRGAAVAHVARHGTGAPDPWGREWAKEWSRPLPPPERSVSVLVWVSSAGPNGLDESGRGDDIRIAPIRVASNRSVFFNLDRVLMFVGCALCWLVFALGGPPCPSVQKEARLCLSATLPVLLFIWLAVAWLEDLAAYRAFGAVSAPLQVGLTLSGMLLGVAAWARWRTHQEVAT